MNLPNEAGYAAQRECRYAWEAWDDLTLEQRCDALREAGDAGEQHPTASNPFDDDDPRALAFAKAQGGAR